VEFKGKGLASRDRFEDNHEAQVDMPQDYRKSAPGIPASDNQAAPQLDEDLFGNIQQFLTMADLMANAWASKAWNRAVVRAKEERIGGLASDLPQMLVGVAPKEAVTQLTKGNPQLVTSLTLTLRHQAGHPSVDPEVRTRIHRALALIVDVCQNLRELTLGDLSLSQLDLELPPRLRHLQFGAPPGTRSRLREIRLRGPQLDLLRVDDCSALVQLDLSRLASVKEISLRRVSLRTGLNLSPTSGLEVLRSQGAYCVQFEPIGLSSLRQLHLEGRGDRPLRLAHHPRLTYLELRGRLDQTVLKLADLPRLRQLRVFDCENLRSIELSRLQGFTDVVVARCPDLGTFRCERVPELTEIWLDDCGQPTVDLRELPYDQDVDVAAESNYLRIPVEVLR
jgi:hypothetical protein